MIRHLTYLTRKTLTQTIRRNKMNPLMSYETQKNLETYGLRYIFRRDGTVARWKERTPIPFQGQMIVHVDGTITWHPSSCRANFRVFHIKKPRPGEVEAIREFLVEQSELIFSIPVPDISSVVDKLVLLMRNGV